MSTSGEPGLSYFQFVGRHWRFLGFGFFLAFFSSFGQTYFVALFGGDIRETFGLSHGDFGFVYSVATLAAGLCLIWLGRQLDDVDLRVFSVLICTALIGACFLFAAVPSVMVLYVAIFSLRLVGQGLMSHTALTSMSRYFDADRGKAISIASLGFPASQAVFPLMVVAMIASLGWRQAWLAFGAMGVVVLVPAVLWLLKGHTERHRALAERMGGTLTARSTPGRGSEFELVLPLPPCPELPLPPLAQLRSIVVVQAAHSAGHEALLGLVKALAPTARIELLAQGSQALALLASTPTDRPHDLLLVDWVLPDMEGSELIASLAAAGPPRVRRTVLLSAFDTPVLRERALRQGAQALCAKPLLPHTLRRLLDIDRPLPAEALPAPSPEATATSTDPATLFSELDTLLSEADSHALTLWERHESAFIGMLPAQRAKALAGAMQRFDFDDAQAALRGEDKDNPP